MRIFLGLRGIIFSIIYMINRRLPFFDFFFNKNTEAKNLVYVPYGIKKIHSEGFYKAFYLYCEIKNKFRDVGVVRNLKKNIQGKNIFYVVDADTKYLNKNLLTEGFAKETDLKFPINSFKSFISQLEPKNNLYPPLKHTLLWENKVFMHKEFERLNINAPKTIIKKNANLIFDELATDLGNKFLFKHPHSAGSRGIVLISCQQDLNRVIEENIDLKELIFQRLVNMKKDLRVILIGKKIILHYWRVNNEEEWRPTSTSHGSEVDFEYFPEKHKSKIIDTFIKFDITQGAFDICWENDDVDGEPIFLEISPAFQPNPNLREYNISLRKNQSYGNWKKTYMFDASYAWVQRDNLKKFQKLYLDSVNFEKASANDT